MWTREFIKERAKEVLRTNYWKAFLASLIIIIAGGSRNGGNYKIRKEYGKYNGNIFNHNIPILTGKSFMFFVYITIILIMLRIFIGYLVEVGGRKFFIKAAKGESNLDYLGYCFKEGRYVKVLGTMLLTDIYIFLWSLLLIIPGIIKSYAYRMVPYILADNPFIGYNRAIELSVNMTEGEKWNIFVLDLSFIGWYLLGILALLVGTLFVVPYEEATDAELYLDLRQSAIESGLTSKAELNIEMEGSISNI